MLLIPKPDIVAWVMSRAPFNNSHHPPIPTPTPLYKIGPNFLPAFRQSKNLSGAFGAK